MELRLIIAVICLFGFVLGVPVYENSYGEKCALQCKNDSSNLYYALGKTYTYDYKSKSILHIENGKKNPEVEITAKVEITPVAPCENILQLRNVEIIGPSETRSLKQALEAKNLRFTYDDGQISSVCASQDDKSEIVNIKKAILSSLQVSTRSLDKSSRVEEKDIMGICETIYEPKDNSAIWRSVASENTKQLKKTKNLRTCAWRQQSWSGVFPVTYDSEKHIAAQRVSPLVSGDYMCDMKIADHRLESSKCTEKSTILPLSRSIVSASVQSSVEIKLQSVEDAKSNVIQSLSSSVGPYNRHKLLYTSDDDDDSTSTNNADKSNEAKVVDLLKSMCPTISDEIQTPAAGYFVDLVRSLRGLSHQAAYRLWQGVQRGEYCATSGSKMQDMFVDALAMDGSDSSVRILLEMINNKEVNVLKQNYLLTLLSFASHPTEATIKATIPLIKNRASQAGPTSRHQLLSVTGLVQNYCRKPKSNCASNGSVREVIAQIIKRLPRKCQVRSDDSTEIDDVVGVLRALANVGQWIPDDVFSSLNECMYSRSKAIQVATLEIMQSQACSRADKLISVLSNTNLAAEVRIAAYRSLVWCPRPEVVRKIMTILGSEQSQQVGSYIVSHLKNIKKSSDPFKLALRDAYVNERLPSEERFPSDLRKYSRNIEYSYMMEKYNSGFALETDIIYDGSIMPRSLRTNFTLPMFGKGQNVFEIGFRQEGIDKSLESILKSDTISRGYQQLQKKNMTDVVKDIVSLARQAVTQVTSDNNDGQQNKNVLSAEKMESLRKKLADLSKHVDGSFYLKVDGKVLTYMSLNDLVNTNWTTIFQSYVSKLRHLSDTDRAFAFLPMSTVYEVPTVNGLPMKVSIDAATVFGYKNTKKGFFPSFASEVSAKLAYSDFAAVQLIKTFNAAPSLQYEVQYEQQRPVSIEFRLPKDKTTLLSFNTDIRLIEKNGNVQSLVAQTQKSHEGCTKSLNKPLGIELCAKLGLPQHIFSFKHPLSLINAGYSFELSVIKSDHDMRGWKLTFDLPRSKQSTGDIVYRFGFNTPGSQINREYAAELEISRPSGHSVKSISAALKSPFKSVKGKIVVTNSEDKIAFQSELIVDDQNKYALELGTTVSKHSSKVTFMPRMTMTWPRATKPFVVEGKVSLTNGQKMALDFNLKTDQQTTGKPLYVSGRIIYNTANDGTKHMSANFNANLGFIQWNVQSEATRQNDQLYFKSNVDYKLANSKAQKAGYIMKVQNLSQPNLSKYVTFAQIESSQFPQANFRVSWNLLHKAFEHLENEIILQSSKGRGRIMQMSTMKGLREAVVITSENLLAVDFAQLGINHEIKLSGYFERPNRNTLAWKIVKIEASAGAKNSASTSSALIDLRHVSSKPLKLEMIAKLRTPTVQWSYSDKLEEVQPNEYRGTTNISWGPSKQTTVAYGLKIKSADNRDHIEVEIEIQPSSQRKPIRLDTVYKRSADHQYQLDAQYNHNGAKLVDLKTQVDIAGPIKASLVTPIFTASLDAQNSRYKEKQQQQRYLNFELYDKIHDVRHKTQVAVSDKESKPTLSIESSTTARSRQVANLKLIASKQETSFFVLDLVPFTARFSVNPYSTPASAKFELRSSPYDFMHTTSMTFESRTHYSIQSKTLRNNSPILTIDGELSAKTKSYLNIVAPKFQAKSTGQIDMAAKRGTFTVNVKDNNGKWDHNTNVAYDVMAVQLDSWTTSAGKKILTIKSTFSLEKESVLEINNERFTGSVRVQPKKERSIAVEMQDRKNGWKHSTLMSYDRQGLKLSTITEKRGEKLFNLNGSIVDNVIQVAAERHDTKAQVYLKRWSELRFNMVNSRRGLIHKTTVRSERSDIVIISKTNLKNRYLNLESKIAPLERGDSYLKLDSSRFNLNARLNMADRDTKQAVLELAVPEWTAEHKTDIKYTVSTSRVQLNSLTKKENHVLFKADAVVDRRSADVTFECKCGNGRLSFRNTDISKNVKFEVHCKSTLSHSSELVLHSGEYVSFQSQTERNGRTLKINAKAAKSAKSYFEAEYNQYLARAEYDRAPFNKHKVHLQVSTTDRSVMHVTDLTIAPRTLDIMSNTEHNRQNIAMVNGHLSMAEPSDLKIASRVLNLSIRVSPFTDEKYARLVLDFTPISIHHESSLALKPKLFNGMLNLSSVTMIGQRKVAEFAIKLSSEDQRRVAHVNLISEPWNLSHQTTMSSESAKFKLDSVTTKDHKPLAKLSFQAGKQYPHTSYAKVDIPYGQYELEVQPFGKKQFQVQIRSPRFNLSHNTEYLPAQRKIKSYSDYQDKTLYNLDAAWSAQNTVVSFTSPVFTFRLDANPDYHKAKVDLKYSKRRILCTLSTVKPSGLEFVLKWDANRDERKILKLSAQRDHNGSETSTKVDLNLMSYEAGMTLKVADKHIAGPHDLVLSLRMPSEQEQQIHFHHEILDGHKMACEIEYREANRVQIALHSRASMEKLGRNGLKAQMGVRVESKNQQIDGLNFEITHEHELGKEPKFNTQIKAILTENKTASITLNANTKGSKFFCTIEANGLKGLRYKDLEMKQDNYHFELKGDLSMTQGDLKANQFFGDKKVAVSAKYNMEREEGKLEATIESQVPHVPNGRFVAQYKSAGLKEQMVKFDLYGGNEKLAYCDAEWKYNGLHNFESKIDTRLGELFSINGRLSGEREKFELNLDTQKRGQQLLKATGNLRASSGLWDGKVDVSCKNENLIDATFAQRRSRIGELLSQMTLKTRTSNYRLSHAVKTTNDQATLNSLEVCSKENCRKAEITLYYNGRLDHRVAIVYKKQNHPVAGFEHVFKHTSPVDFRVSNVLSVGDQKYGYSVKLMSKDKLVAQSLLGQRESELRVEMDRSVPKLTIELIPKTSEETNKLVLEAGRELISAEKGRYEAIFFGRLLHRSLRKPLQAEMKVKRTNVRSDLQLTLDYSRSNEKLVLTANTNFIPSNQNTTFSLNLRQPETGKTFVDLKGHIATDKSILLTTGMNYAYMGRRGLVHTGHVYSQVDLNRHEAYYHREHDNKKVHITGKYSVDSQTHLSRIEGHIERDDTDEHYVRDYWVTFDMKPTQPCLHAEVKDAKNSRVTYRVHSCVAVEGSRVLKFVAESYDSDNTKSTDAKLVFEKASDRRIVRGTLHWKPELISKAIAALKNIDHNSLMHEVSEELKHKQNLLVDGFARDVYHPLSASLAQDWHSFTRDTNLYKLEKYVPNMESISKAWPSVTNELDEFARTVARYAKKVCPYKSLCHRMAYAYEKNGFKGVQSEIRKAIANFIEKHKQMMVRINGSVKEFQEAATQLKQRLMEAIDKMVEPYAQMLKNSRPTQMALEKIESFKQTLLDYQSKYWPSVEKYLRKLEDWIMSNDDTSAIYKVVRKIAQDIAKEFDRVDIDQIKTLLKDMAKTLLKPENWFGQQRYLTYNLDQGVVEFEVNTPISVETIKKMVSKKSTKSTNAPLLNRLVALKANMLPQYKAQAMLVAGQHYVTFDDKMYDFASPQCIYTLVNDFEDKNFTAMIKYNGQKDNEVAKSFILKFGKKVVELSADGEWVKLDGRYTELPYSHDNLAIENQGKNIVIQDQANGIVMDCDTEYDLCTLSMAGWYFGKTKGLFGTYDHETSNDMELPNGAQANSVQQWASEWQVENGCQTTNTARQEKASKDSKEYKLCQQLFEDQSSTLASGYSVVLPKNYMSMCLSTLARKTQDKATQEKGLCTIAAAYVKSLKHAGMDLSMPPKCLSCDNMEFGSKTELKNNNVPRKADIVYVVEESTCNRRVVDQLDTISKYIERQLGSVDTKFGLIGVGSEQYQNGKVHKHTADGKLLFEARKVVYAANKLAHFGQKAENTKVDAYEAIVTAAEYPFRLGASKTIVLINCDTCSKQSESRMDYTDIHRMLQQYGIVLHVISQNDIKLKGHENKQKSILAVDSQSVYGSKDISTLAFEGQKKLRSQVKLASDVCIPLAHESNGAYFSSAKLAHNSKEWNSVVALRVAKTAQPSSCQRCFCTMDKDHIHSKTVCKPCKAY